MASHERRRYARGSHFHCTAKLSTDQITWREVKVHDLSSGGLKLRSSQTYELGATLWFDLVIQGFFSEFEVKVQGVVRRVGPGRVHHTYGIAFQGLSEEMQVRIDENVQGDRPINRDPYLFD